MSTPDSPSVGDAGPSQGRAAGLKGDIFKDIELCRKLSLLCLLSSSTLLYLVYQSWSSDQMVEAEVAGLADLVDAARDDPGRILSDHALWRSEEARRLARKIEEWICVGPLPEPCEVKVPANGFRADMRAPVRVVDGGAALPESGATLLQLREAFERPWHIERVGDLEGDDEIATQHGAPVLVRAEVTHWPEAAGQQGMVRLTLMQTIRPPGRNSGVMQSRSDSMVRFSPERHEWRVEDGFFASSFPLITARWGALYGLTLEQAREVAQSLRLTPLRNTKTTVMGISIDNAQAGTLIPLLILCALVYTLAHVHRVRLYMIDRPAPERGALPWLLAAPGVLSFVVSTGTVVVVPALATGLSLWRMSGWSPKSSAAAAAVLLVVGGSVLCGARRIAHLSTPRLRLSLPKLQFSLREIFDATVVLLVVATIARMLIKNAPYESAKSLFLAAFLIVIMPFLATSVGLAFGHAIETVWPRSKLEKHHVGNFALLVAALLQFVFVDAYDSVFFQALVVNSAP